MTLKLSFAISECTALILLLIVVSATPVLAQQATFYFHDNSELTFSYPPFQLADFQVSGIQANPSSSSAQIFETATPDVPTGSGMAVAMSSTISVSGQTQGYAAFVAWVTPPFPATVTLDGSVVMYVWMSSNDVLLPWQGSEFFVGVADYSPSSSTQFQLLDDYVSNASIGYNGFTNSPNEYIINTMRINQYQFQAGSMLMFFAGAGSNKQGYSFTVYFDSPTWQSRADIPADPNLTVSEFPNLLPIILSTLLLPIIQTKRRKAPSV
ncbi:MAG: hypothetical protein ABSF63_04255 [Candidatus Bathyarchaeia archaeon]